MLQGGEKGPRTQVGLLNQPRRLLARRGSYESRSEFRGVDPRPPTQRGQSHQTEITNNRKKLQDEISRDINGCLVLYSVSSYQGGPIPLSRTYLKIAFG